MTKAKTLSMIFLIQILSRGKLFPEITMCYFCKEYQKGYAKLKQFMGQFIKQKKRTFLKLALKLSLFHGNGRLRKKKKKKKYSMHAQCKISAATATFFHILLFLSTYSCLPHDKGVYPQQKYIKNKLKPREIPTQLRQTQPIFPFIRIITVREWQQVQNFICLAGCHIFSLTVKL